MLRAIEGSRNSKALLWNPRYGAITGLSRHSSRTGRGLLKTRFAIGRFAHFHSTNISLEEPPAGCCTNANPTRSPHSALKENSSGW
jgi:hypothetical protein